MIFRAHPFSYDFAEDTAVITRIHDLLRADAAATGRQHLFGAAAESDLGIIDCMNASDAMVSDVSSVVSDYLISEKPLAIVAVPCPIPQFVDDYPVARAAYVVDGALDNLEPVLDELLGADSHADARRQVRDYYLGDFAGRPGYAQVFVQACLDLIDAPPAEATGGVDDSIEVDRARASTLMAKFRVLFAQYGRDLLLAAVAATGFLLATAESPDRREHRGAGRSSALCMVASRRAVLGGEALDRTLGALVVARVLVAFTALVLWAEAGSMLGQVVCALVAALTVIELPIRGGWSGPGTGVLHLAGMEDPPPPKLARGMIAIGNVLQLAVDPRLVLVPVTTADLPC